VEYGEVTFFLHRLFVPARLLAEFCHLKASLLLEAMISRLNRRLRSARFCVTKAFSTSWDTRNFLTFANTAAGQKWAGVRIIHEFSGSRVLKRQKITSQT